MTTSNPININSSESELIPFMCYGDRKLFSDYHKCLWPNHAPTPPDKSKYFVDIVTHLVYGREISIEDIPIITDYITNGYTVQAKDSNIVASLFKNEPEEYASAIAKYESDLTSWYEERKNAIPVLQSIIDRAVSCKLNFISNEKVQRLISEGKIKL